MLICREIYYILNMARNQNRNPDRAMNKDKKYELLCFAKKEKEKECSRSHIIA